MIELQRRLATFGEARLTDREVLAFLAGTESAADRLMRAFGGLEPLSSASLAELQEHVSKPTACRIQAAFGLTRRLIQAPWRPGASMRHGGDVARLIRETTRGTTQEMFFVILLDARNRLKSIQTVAIGTADAVSVHPREVFSPAVRDKASSVVVAHNHPSGDPTPSPEDRKVTDRLRETGELLGIELIDHIVVGAERYYSFASEGFYPVG